MGSVEKFRSFHSVVTKENTTTPLKNRKWLWLRFLALLTGLTTLSIPAQAQLIPDSSLGTESSTVTPQQVRDLIEGGAIRGNNLFHSFSEFNVNDSQAVYFVNPTGIENILTRVTGNNISNILGTLGVEGTATLFLLNPNGILFGENAQLDLNGSFFATTGNSLVFENGFAFSAENPISPPLLTVNLPLGVQYGNNALGNLNNAGNLALESGQRIVFNGNEIHNTGTLTAPEGQVELLGNEVTLGDGTAIEADLIRIQAENNITVANQSNDQLRLAGYGGLVEMLAGGDVVMEDTLNDTIQTVGGNLAISGASILLGNVDTSFYETSGGELIATVNVDAGGEITDATSEPGVSLFTFTVPELEDPIENLDVRFSAAHPWVSDLVVTLTSPTGTAFELFNGVGESGENFQDTLLNDEAEWSLVAGLAPFNGTFRPHGEGGLAVFNGETASGVWELTVADNFGGYSGTLYRAGDTAPWGEAIGTQLILRTPVVVEASGASGAISLNATGGNLQVGKINATSPLGVGGQIDLQATGEIGLRGTLAGHSDIRVRANEGIIVYDIPSNTLDLPSGQGEIVFYADANEDGVGDFFMEDSLSDMIWTNGKNITIEGMNLSIGAIQTVREDGGSGGTITLNAGGSIFASFLDSFSWSSDENAGNGGAISLSAGGSISTQSLNSSGENGGAITLQSSNGQISLTNAQINSTSHAEFGRGGNVLIQTGAANPNISAIQLINTGIDAAAFGSSGKSGNITIEATNGGSIKLLGQSGVFLIFSDTFASDEQVIGQKMGGDTRILGGNILIENYDLNAVVRDGAVGDGGDIEIRGSAVTLNNTYVLTSTSSLGNAGSIQTKAEVLTVLNGSILEAKTEGQGNAGDITIQATDSVTVSGITQDDIKSDILTSPLEVQNIEDSSFNGGLFAQAIGIGSGKAGNIRINTGVLTLQNGTQATVSSPEGQAGNLEVTAQSVFLNQGKLTADTGTNEGANITLQLSNLLHLSNESLISANANKTANGGNINLNADFIIALPPEGIQGSDIIANASEGDGGRITINADSIFGLQFREQQTPQNDITASSELGLAGVVEINTPDVDPSQGLVELPENVVDTTNLVAQGCSGGKTGIASQQSEFIITGRGGLPQNPNESLMNDSILTDWVALPESYSQSSVPVEKTLTAETPVVEAQGWVVDATGKIILTATPAKVSPHSAPQKTASCSAQPQG